MSNRKVGIEFYVAGGANVARDVHKIAGTLGSVAKIGMGIGGATLIIRTATRVVGGFIQAAANGSKEVAAQVTQLSGTWNHMKDTVVQEVAPQMVDALELVNAAALKTEAIILRSVRAYKDAVVGFGDLAEAAASRGEIINEEAKKRYKLQYPNDAKAFTDQFYPGGFGGGVATIGPTNQAAYEAIRQQLLNEQRGLEAARRAEREQAAAAPPPAVPRQTIAPEMAKARDEIFKLNTALGEQILIQAEVAKGNKNAAETVRFKTAAEMAFVGDAKAQNKAMEEYARTLRIVQQMKQQSEDSEASLKARDEVDKLNAALQEQIRIQTLASQGNQYASETVQFEAAVLKAYTGDVDRQRQAIEEYAKSLEQLGRIQQDADDAKAASKAATQAKDDVAKLNAELDREFAIIGRLNDSHERAAKAVEYESAVRKAYAGDIETQNRMLEDYETKLKTLEKHRQLVETGKQFGDAWGTAFEDFAMGASTARQAIQGLITDIQRMVIRQTISQPSANFMSQAFISAFSGAAAKPTMGSAGTGGVHQYHTGGVPLYDRTALRQVDLSIFRHAARAHTGIGPGERPVIIRNDEGVFTPGQMRAMGGGASSARMESLLGDLLGEMRRQGEKKMVILDRRRGVTRDEIPGIIIDDLDHGGPVATAFGRT